MAHARNVDAARGHIGRHQNIQLTFTEFRQRAVAVVLAFVAMDGRGLEPPSHQQFVQLFRAVFGATKDQGLLARMFQQIGFQQFGLVAVGDVMHPLDDLFHRLARRGHLNAHRIAQVGARDFLDVVGHGGREQQRLAVLRDVFGDFAQRVDKAHVQHMVSLIQHQIAAGFQRHSAAFQQVDQAAGGGNQHVRAFSQTIRLSVQRRAAHNHGDFDSRALGEGQKVFGNLRHKFACGR